MVSTPKLAVEALVGQSLYYNGQARTWIAAQRPELLTAEDKQDGSERVRAFAQAVQSPNLFRQLDRQNRFDTLFLVGDPSTYRPLLDHLLDTPDWTLTYLDHTSLIFHRAGNDPWTEAKLQALRGKFAEASARDRAAVLAGTAVKLIAVRKRELGKKLADEAVELDSGLPDGWSARARYHLERGEWNPAIADADRALEIDGDYMHALASKAQALYATKHFTDAYRVSKKLIEKMPDDPGVLFYYAKICHEAHAFEEEIKALQKLISLAELCERPTSEYRIYLGQAFARTGKGPEALEQYGKALADPDLPRDQQAEVGRTMEQIRSKVGAEGGDKH
jgi:tetratricopeptide (TPR) repeat protein